MRFEPETCRVAVTVACVVSVPARMRVLFARRRSPRGDGVGWGWGWARRSGGAPHRGGAARSRRGRADARSSDPAPSRPARPPSPLARARRAGRARRWRGPSRLARRRMVGASGEYPAERSTQEEGDVVTSEDDGDDYDPEGASSDGGEEVRGARPRWRPRHAPPRAMGHRTGSPGRSPRARARNPQRALVLVEAARDAVRGGALRAASAPSVGRSAAPCISTPGAATHRRAPLIPARCHPALTSGDAPAHVADPTLSLRRTAEAAAAAARAQPPAAARAQAALPLTAI